MHVDSLLAYYGVPLLFTGDDGYFALTSDDQVRAALQRQVDGMLVEHYDHSETYEPIQPGRRCRATLSSKCQTLAGATCLA